MSKYEDIAPNVSKVIDQASFTADFPPPPEPEPEPPAPAAALALQLYQRIRDGIKERSVPHFEIARDLGIPVRWVRVFHREIQRALALLEASREQ